MPYKHFIFENSSIAEYIGLDIQSALEYDERIKPDFFWNGSTMPFEDQTFDTLMATEVLEHCPDPDIILKESFRVLKPAGVFFFTTPFLWNLHEVPHDEYRYTPFSLKRHLAKAGFKDIEIYASGGWHASLAQFLGLWVRRSPMKPRRRKYISMIVKPIVRRLLKWDNNLKVEFKEGAMINTIYGIARR
jgi:ubiquinone/menaquinone biosynthesis C-methylase UbiE